MFHTLKFAFHDGPATSYDGTQQNAVYNVAVDVLKREPSLPKRSGNNHPDDINNRTTAWRQANRLTAYALYYTHAVSLHTGEKEPATIWLLLPRRKQNSH